MTPENVGLVIFILCILWLLFLFLVFIPRTLRANRKISLRSRYALFEIDRMIVK
jgi:hypothetical protein